MTTALGHLAALVAVVSRADQDTLHLLATTTRVMPWWGRLTASVVRDGPAVAILLWMVNLLLLPAAAERPRAAQVRALAGALVTGAAWAVAWAVVPLRTYPAGFAAAAASQAAVSGLPLGGALLSLGIGDAGTSVGALLRVVVVAYAVARLGIGADGPLRVLAQAASAVVAALVLARTEPFVGALEGLTRDLSSALGLRAVRATDPGRI